MRLHFQEKPWDLYISLGYTAVMSGILLGLGAGNLPAILLVLFVPGYVLVAALFPGNKQIDWTERIALSFGLSIAVVPLLGLLLNFTPFGIRFVPIVATIALFSGLVGFAAHLRRRRLPTGERLSATLDIAKPAWQEYTLLDRILTIALAASIVVVSAALAYVVATPRPGERFTEFYILGPGGNASGYPTELNVSEPGTVIMGIVNQEAATVNYTVRVDLVGVEIVYNGTSGFNETVERNRTALAWFNATLDDERNWTEPYTFTIATVGLWKVQFLLFRDADFAIQSRSLHLFVKVAST